MCGIAGALTRDPGAGARVDVEALGAALAHRGPDGAGDYAEGPVVLVHRRLAIIDPTEGGRQPMATSDGRHVLVFNGEVYNYRELRRALEGAGERFATASDTEVLLRLLAREGPAALARVRGMFALAIWDGRERRLTLARDRFGIKPLYVAATGARVAFASEIGALRRAALVPRAVRPAGVLAFLAWGWVPGPLTWLEGVESLEPGTWRSWDEAGAESGGCFADVRDAYAPAPPADEADLRAAASAAVRDTVRAHLVADVPVGIFLSGGVDSGAVLSAARSVTGGPLRAYTVAGDADPEPESVVAGRVAARFGAEHQVLTLDATRLSREWPAILARLDSPTLDGVNAWAVSQAVAASGVKAVLSGVGGDELFGGYPSFRLLPRAARLARAGGPALRLAGLAARALPGWRARKWAHFASAPGAGAWPAYRALRGLFMPEEWPALLGPALEGAAGEAARAGVEAAERAMARGPRGAAPAADAARLETTVYLRHQLLRDLDAMSMAHSLEVRVPFVDHALLGAVWPALGGHAALRRGKRLLWQGLERPLPDEVVAAPKRGFTLPFDAWMRGPLEADVRAGLDTLEGQGWLRAGAGAEQWDAWRAGRAHWSRVWALATLGRFLEAAP